MRKLAIAAALAGTFGFAAPALAGPGQCYDAYGRPIGPVYDTDYPNYSFINSVVRRGGSCTGTPVSEVVSEPISPPPEPSVDALAARRSGAVIVASETGRTRRPNLGLVHRAADAAEVTPRTAQCRVFGLSTVWTRTRENDSARGCSLRRSVGTGPTHRPRPRCRSSARAER